jgi:hypothetical protein
MMQHLDINCIMEGLILTSRNSNQATRIQKPLSSVNMKLKLTLTPVQYTRHQPMLSPIAEEPQYAQVLDSWFRSLADYGE